MGYGAVSTRCAAQIVRRRFFGGLHTHLPQLDSKVDHGAWDLLRRLTRAQGFIRYFVGLLSHCGN